ncbi:MAG TPA: alkaline phosphatase [Nocardioides bacterium]|nr:alkaline phosphatase [Nocardioides sp.]
MAVGWPGAAPNQIRSRLPLAHGARSGEVTTDSAVVWARSAGSGRLTVRLASNGRVLRTVRGPWADERTDHTARVQLRGLAPGRRYDATVWFTNDAGATGQTERVSFSTAPVHAAAQSVVWSGDTCGQGFGINEELGGLTTYRAVLRTQPDLFVHCGDTVYADLEIPPSFTEESGVVWRNVVSDGVEKVSETLEEFRGRQRYVLQDTHVRELYAQVPTIAQWDDHETCNNWYPGELLEDDRYTERRCDVLAARGRRAWQEYQPVPVRTLIDRSGDGYATGRIYRRVPRGQHLDLFVLDMRSYRGPNDTFRVRPQGILGADQERWLTDSVIASTATWKVISADLPLSIPSTHDDDLDGPCNGDDGPPLGREPELARILSAWRRAGVRNVVFVTADVHYTAAHHYAPERAAYTDFDPFWEFVSGPLAAETFPRKDGVLDGTFGPQVVFSKGNDSPRRQSPRDGNQFFGHLAIDAAGALTVTLHEASGAAVWSRTLDPA